MADYPSPAAIAKLQADLSYLVSQLPQSPNGDVIIKAINSLLKIAESDVERLDWKILGGTLQDMARAFPALYPHRHVRKVSIFGSARTASDRPEYQMAKDFAKAIVDQGFMVITGAGPGIMQAGNEGAGPDNSFGLNIQLPFEQGSNPFIEHDPKLVSFKYFFTRKLFFLKESDAIALFPGGFGTLDEAFETITLIQTGKSLPIPLVMIDAPGGDYWKSWARYINENLTHKGLISSDDSSLFLITDRIEVACDVITNFYRVYHSSRYVGEQLVLRLKTLLSRDALLELNDRFGDILVKGTIEQTTALPQELQDETSALPRLVLHFNQRDLGRLYQLIWAINRLGSADNEGFQHPEWK
jgi:uncharacterized protein (TIGR00730 family)